MEPGVNFIDLTGMHAGRHRVEPRPWAAVTGITLHQTACLIGDNRDAWYNVPVHVGVSRAGNIYLLNPFDQLVWHGHGLSRADVGIEIDGYFSGIAEDPRTLWRPPQDPDRKPLEPPALQLQAARAAVWLIIDTVRMNGGAIRHIHAHRQGSNMRQSDPGSRVWQEVGVWAQREYGLGDGGPGFTLGTGLPIPEAWDARRAGVRY